MSIVQIVIGLILMALVSIGVAKRVINGIFAMEIKDF